MFINKDALTNVKTTFKMFIKDRFFNVTGFIHISIPLAPLREVVKKKNGLFMVRLTVKVDPPLPPPYGQGVVIFSK